MKAVRHRALLDASVIGYGQALAAVKTVNSHLDDAFEERASVAILCEDDTREKKLQDIGEELDRALELCALAEEGLADAVSYLNEAGHLDAVELALRARCQATEHTRLVREMWRTVGQELERYV